MAIIQSNYGLLRRKETVLGGRQRRDVDHQWPPYADSDGQG
jgi:hypothetical protein